MRLSFSEAIIAIVVVALAYVVLRRRHLVDRVAEGLLNMSGTRENIERYERELAVAQQAAAQAQREGRKAAPAPSYKCSWWDKYVWKFANC